MRVAVGSHRAILLVSGGLLVCCLVACSDGGSPSTGTDAIDESAGTADTGPEGRSPPPSSSGEAAAKISLRRASKLDEPDRFEVAGLTQQELDALKTAELDVDQWRQLLAVHVDSDEAPSGHAMFGEYSVEETLLVFVPRFPLQPGLTYRVALSPARLPGATETSSPPIERVFTLPPPPPTPPTVVRHVFPSRDALPENQLKFYIHFSAPMSQGEAYGRIRLVRSSGEEVADPFLELDEELWDYSGTRFTLFIDPGRIKRELKPRLELGPALVEGQSYALLIDRRWADAAGQPLQDGFRKEFTVTEPDHTQPSPRNWTVQAPASGTNGELIVLFGEPLDEALARRVITVTDGADQYVVGKITVDREETRWRFLPDQAWQAGRHNLVIDTILEDLAGNSIGRPFEVDIVRPVERRVETRTVSLPFEVPPAALRID